MKTTFTILFCSIVLITAAQPCVRDTSIKTTGIYPTTLATATGGVPYSQVIQLRMATDTTIMYMGSPVSAKIDSIKVLNVLNMPPGLSYQCNPVSCVMPAGVTNCALISGTVPAGNDGHYDFKIPILIYGKVFGFAQTQYDTIRSVNMDVGSATGIEAKGKSLVSYPNPAGEKFNIVTGTENFQVKIYNTSGKEFRVASAYNGTHIEIEAAGIEPGVYYIILSNEREVLSVKMIKSPSPH